MNTVFVLFIYMLTFNLRLSAFICGSNLILMFFSPAERGVCRTGGRGRHNAPGQAAARRGRDRVRRRRDCRSKAPQGLFPVHRVAAYADEFEAPGAHAKCLAAMCPEPCEEHERDQQEADTQGIQQPQRPIRVGQVSATHGQ